MSAAEKRQIFYTNMRLLGFEGRAPPVFASDKVVAFNVDMFKVPNRSAFEVATLFLFTRLNPTRAKEEFRDCWPTIVKQREQEFRRVCNGWLCQIAQDEPDCYLPKIAPSLFQSPGGDRFCELMFAFSSYVLIHVIKHEHGVKSRDMLSKPILTPQNMVFSTAMEKSMKCGVINNRRKFFESVQTRETLHQLWQKSASEMVTEYRSLNKEIRQKESDIKSVLNGHAEKGFRSPVRRDKMRKSLTPASKHGRVFDVNMETVKREEKVKKVRELWHIVEKFLSDSSSQQDVVSSILSGVVHKYVLNASELDLRVPEMLLRECERELFKRDIGNTYKSGKLDLVSILNLWNLSMHLYLERFEDGDRLDLTNQLRDLEPKVHAQNEQLHSSKQLAASLGDELIPELKESIRRLKADEQRKRQHRPPYVSKLGMSLQANSPPLSFDPNKASDADVRAAQLTFTPDTLSKESTPDAVSRILKSVTTAIKPLRLVCKDLTNQLSASTTRGTPPPESIISPLAQGKLVRTRHVDMASSSFGSASSPARGNIQVSKVGSKQVTQVVKEPNEQDVFSPDSEYGQSLHTSNLDGSGTTAGSDKLGGNYDTTPTSTRVARASGPTNREVALNKLYSQMEAPPTAVVGQESPSNVLAARIAQSIIEDGDVETMSPIDEQLSGAVDSLYHVTNVLDELGLSGFEKKDKLRRTPDTTGLDLDNQEDENMEGRVVIPSLHKPTYSETLSDVEDNIITVETQETERSSYSDESSQRSSSPCLADNVTNMSQRAISDSKGNNHGQESMAANEVSADQGSRRESLRGHVYWTPETCRAARKRQSVGVMDEQPEFIDSPMCDSMNANDVDADLLDLLPPDLGLGESSGFVPSPLSTYSTQAGASLKVRTNAGNSGAQVKVKSQPQYTMEELAAQLTELKRMTSAAEANQRQLSTAASHLAGMLSPANQKSVASGAAAQTSIEDEIDKLLLLEDDDF